MPNNLVIIIMDSCRYDSFRSAATPNVDRIGPVELRYSYASWTSPAHYAFLMGLVPHASPKGVFASEVYKEEFTKWDDRLDIEGLSFKSFIPALSLPKVLQEHGYRTVARVSMPVLNPFTSLNRHFDDYKLMPNHNDFAGMVEEISFYPSQPSFYFLNLGETHYPYMLDPNELPHISGVHGVFRRISDTSVDDRAEEPQFFDHEQMQGFHGQQVRCAEYVDSVFGRLLDKCPPNTYFIITSDHGECFGEGGYFGHGPIVHEKVLEVPFVEGPRP